MEGFLAILDPMPLFPEDGAVVFYDGQPRDERGRFTFGKRIDIARTKGITGKISMAEALKILESPLAVWASDGRKAIFDGRLVRKYRDGIGRKDGATPNRLLHLGRAVFAVRETNYGVVDLPDHIPPQRQYLHKIGKRKAIVVYVDADDHVRSFIYNSHKNADRFLENKRGR